MSEEKPKSKSSFLRRFTNEGMYERKKAKLLKKLNKEYTGSVRRKELADLEAKIKEHKTENRKTKRKVKIGGFRFEI